MLEPTVSTGALGGVGGGVVAGGCGGAGVDTGAVAAVDVVLGAATTAFLRRLGFGCARAGVVTVTVEVGVDELDDGLLPHAVMLIAHVAIRAGSRRLGRVTAATIQTAHRFLGNSHGLLDAWLSDHRSRAARRSA